MASPTPSTLSSLYRHLLRTSRSTFQGDQRMLTAWRQFVRQKLPEQAGARSNAALPDEVVKEWLDVAKMLRMNVVQGVKDDQDEVYRLRFTSDTELGTNESIKKGREQQLANLKASKGVLGCGGSSRPSASSSSPSTSSSSSSSARAFSTSSSRYAPRDPSKLKSPRPQPLPHPPAHFPSITLLADGSSISLHTTSPRSSQRLTRDPTNHPLWNPKMDARAGSGGEDEAGRMERFRKRFAEVVQESQGQEGSEAGAGGEQQEQEVSLSEGEAEAQEAATLGAGGRKKKAMFEMEDLDWMSEGGRQAKAAARPVYGKGGAGGKRK
ncbi:hypothetical protein BCV69DRAFT_313328 [Microstroma glucosiphilum]|uniref:Mitochondrial zinc maintenance protein 1, mitochondrial n=1 Tax=Pseudomicrostroma glucosiphilum TaxID=1684307 RepID=A0A316U4E6_9BASI|nr:hypothetical protein BCV69DRAFT_313328 [Pseudomicrostroma glucosiphilum]PWN20136.1 hypothetical protein BCV69DRAFT_313328 [Pseudomicrostroma glucosiphilum]